MRKFITTVGLVLYSLVALPAPASATDAAPPACPLQGDYVVALTHSFLLGWNDQQNRLGPFPASIPAGTYELTVASWDDHSTKPAQDDEQPNEIWSLAAHSAGTEIARSSTTPDLPGGQDLLVGSLGRIEFTADVDSFMAHHGFFDAYNPNSVVPLCAGLTEIQVTPVLVAIAAAPVVEDAAPAASPAVASHTAPVEGVPAVASAAPESVIAVPSGSLLTDPAPVTRRQPYAVPVAVLSSRTETPADLPGATAVMGIQAQLTELPNTGLHGGMAAVGLLTLAFGLVLLRLGRDPARAEL